MSSLNDLDQARREFYLAMLKRFRVAIDEAEKFAEVNPTADLFHMVDALTTMKMSCKRAAKEKSIEVLRVSTVSLLASCKP